MNVAWNLVHRIFLSSGKCFGRTDSIVDGIKIKEEIALLSRDSKLFDINALSVISPRDQSCRTGFEFDCFLRSLTNFGTSRCIPQYMDCLHAFFVIFLHRIKDSLVCLKVCLSDFEYFRLLYHLGKYFDLVHEVGPNFIPVRRGNFETLIEYDHQLCEFYLDF